MQAQSLRYSSSNQELEGRLRCWTGAILGGGAVPEFPACGDHRLRQFLLQHGVHAAILDAATRRTAFSLSPSLYQFLLQDYRHLAAVEMVQADEVAQVLHLTRTYLPQPLLVLKGAALAYQIYAYPHVRVRGDIDVLMDHKLTHALKELLEGRGYRVPVAIDGSVIMQQRSFVKCDASGIVHTWDVHWSLSNRPAFAAVLTLEELLNAAVEVRMGDTTFLAPNPVDALLIACIHLMGHHSTDIRMIWLYDMHLLAKSFSERESGEFLVKAGRTPEVQSACHAALELTQRYMPSEPTDALRRALDPGADKRWPLDQSHAARLAADARALSPGDRLRFARQHLFPSAEYMMKRFAIRHRWQLPFWYAIRIGRAVPKLFRRR